LKCLWRRGDDRQDGRGRSDRGKVKWIPTKGRMKGDVGMDRRGYGYSILQDRVAYEDVCAIQYMLAQTCRLTKSNQWND
jgi:hypothetical protein